MTAFDVRFSLVAEVQRAAREVRSKLVEGN